MTETCPECDREFDSQRGVNAHMGQKHPDAKRKTVECDYCGDTREVLKCNTDPDTRDFCGNDCRTAFMSEFMQGENNPSWNGGKTSIECEWCGEEKKVTPAAKERTKYCSKECYGNAMSAKPPEETPNYQGGSAILDCEECGSQFSVKNARKEDATYCGRECMSEAYTRKTGNDAPAWGGGAIDYYGPNWEEQRRKALERDNYTCQDCGVDKDEYEWIDVHHKIPIKNYITDKNADYEAANRLGNLICLCRLCHRKWEKVPGLQPDTRL